jgi:hypothetical protein
MVTFPGAGRKRKLWCSVGAAAAALARISTAAVRISNLFIVSLPIPV